MNVATITIDDMRDALNWVEHLGLPEDVNIIARYHSNYEIDVSLFCSTKEDLRAVRRLVGSVEKHGTGQGMTLRCKVLHGKVTVDIYPPMGSCRMVETDEIEEYQHPVAFETRTRPKTVWDCDEVLT